MTTLGGSLSRTFYNHMLARANQPKVRHEWGFAVVLNAVFKCLMHLCGFGALTYAGYTINITTAFIVGGISCFIFSWMVTSDQEKPAEPQLRR
jgi:hypothetical protein